MVGLRGPVCKDVAWLREWLCVDGGVTWAVGGKIFCPRRFLAFFGGERAGFFCFFLCILGAIMAGAFAVGVEEREVRFFGALPFFHDFFLRELFGWFGVVGGRLVFYFCSWGSG